MPNYCDYEMKIKGKKDNIDAFIRKLNDYDEDNHFWRIFEANVEEETDTYAIVSGYCAWSIESCCRASGYSEGVDLFAVNTENLNLSIEVWSKEDEGMMFEEHYIYDNGKCIVNEAETINYIPYWEKEDYPEFKDFAEDYFGSLDNCPFKETDFGSNGEYIGSMTEGGFKDWGTYSI